MKKILVFYLFFIAFQSCQEHDDITAVNTLSVANTNLVESAFLNAYNGAIQIRHDQGSIDSTGVPQEAYFMRYGGDVTSSFNPPTTIKLNDKLELSIHESYNVLQEETSVSSLFGSEMTIKIDDESQGPAKSNNIEVGYVPEVLKSNINNIPLQLSNKESLITWNPDVRNSNGVYLIADSNQNFSGPGSAGCTDYVLLPDTGIYTYNRDDFPCISRGSLVSFTIVRGLSAELIDNKSEGKDIILAYTTNGQLLYTD